MFVASHSALANSPLRRASIMDGLNLPSAEEIWKPFPEKPQYEISNFGRVRRRGKIRKQRVDKDGYLSVNLSMGLRNHYSY